MFHVCWVALGPVPGLSAPGQAPQARHLLSSSKAAGFWEVLVLAAGRASALGQGMCGTLPWWWLGCSGQVLHCQPRAMWRLPGRGEGWESREGWYQSLGALCSLWGRRPDKGEPREPGTRTPHRQYPWSPSDTHLGSPKKGNLWDCQEPQQCRERGYQYTLELQKPRQEGAPDPQRGKTREGGRTPGWMVVW